MLLRGRVEFLRIHAANDDGVVLLRKVLRNDKPSLVHGEKGAFDAGPSPPQRLEEQKKDRRRDHMHEVRSEQESLMHMDSNE